MNGARARTRRARALPRLVTVVLVVLVVLVAAVPTNALAQRDGGPAGEAALAPTPEKPDKSEKADKGIVPPEKIPGAPAAPEGDGDGDEHAAAPPPGTKGPAFHREPAILKDGMLRIPGGRFTMGTSDKNAPANERPARSVAVPGFWIDRTEVSVGAYRACVDRGACARPTRSSPMCTFELGDPQLPMACVSWTAANAYCLAIGKRLPREVEWETAARGTSAIKYPWGGGPGCGVAAMLAGETTNRSCSGKHPSKVGAHGAGASPYGVQDMSGNVEEWVADWYADTVSELSPRAGSSHVLRGGGWLTAPSLARTTTRNWGSVREAGPNVGFRCAKDD